MSYEEALGGMVLSGIFKLGVVIALIFLTRGIFKINQIVERQNEIVKLLGELKPEAKKVGPDISSGPDNR